METGAIVGEAGAAERPAGGLARIPPGVRRAGLALAAMALLVGSVALGSLTSPFHYLDALAVVAIAIVPALAVLAGYVLYDHGVPPSLVAGGAKAWLRLGPLVLCGVVLLPGNLVLYANQRLDRSPAVIETVPVTDAWIRRGRSGQRAYMVGVATQVTSPLGRFSFYDAQPVDVARNAWTTILPGRTRLLLRVHHGVFGFPWFESAPARAASDGTANAAIRETLP